MVSAGAIYYRYYFIYISRFQWPHKSTLKVGDLAFERFALIYDNQVLFYTSALCMAVCKANGNNFERRLINTKSNDN